MRLLRNGICQLLVKLVIVDGGVIEAHLERVLIFGSSWKR
jgi:hypothetical protein